MLINKLKEDRIKHFKLQANNPESKIGYSVLGVLIGDATKESKEPEDAKVIALIKKFIENAKVCLDNSSERVSIFSAETEISLLKEYLPKQLTEEEIRANIQMCINNGHLNIGMIMKFFKEQYSGQYDGALVSKIAKEIL